MEGRILGGRYELLERIGGGGMAVVYKARCQLLDRFVAIKILRPEFINDEEFVKRFRIEAQAAASLSHPNIVSIFDVGREDNIHYIVMEYIDGVTLKEHISKVGFLPWKKAVGIAIQICSAIEQAHRNHIVHRDIKPHNIMLTSEGIAKVTDFGIARAVSASTITMAGSTIGSVHYFSPEQARGGFIDEKSDLYSLGIALYEMVTGRVPFDGETPVAVALKHIQNQAKSPIELNESIHKGVSDIIMKAIRKDQNKRYQTASEMLSDLNAVLKNPDGVFIDIDDSDKQPTKRIQALGAENFIQEEGFDNMNGNKHKDRKKDRFTVLLAVLTSIIIMITVVYVTYRVVFPAIISEPDEFEVLNYVGRSIEEVKNELDSLGVKYKENPVFDDNVPKDTIISQSIEEGQKLKRRGINMIEFEVSKGMELVVIPDLRFNDYRTAETSLKFKGLNTTVKEEFNDIVANGLVIRTVPEADSEVKPGSSVTIFRSKGPEMERTQVPNVVGRNRSEAQKLLNDAGLVIGKMEPSDTVSEVSKIIEQYPPAETAIEQGAAVDLKFDTEELKKGNNGIDEEEKNTEIKYEQEIKEIKKVVVPTKINLDNPWSYGEKVKILIEVIPSDTNKAETIMNEKKDKTDFPITVDVPVPENGKTTIRVFINNEFYTEFYRWYTGG